jgi:hypothetical protein
VFTDTPSQKVGLMHQFSDSCIKLNIAISLEAVHQGIVNMAASPAGVPLAQTAYFLTEGICIQAKQCVTWSPMEYHAYTDN